MATKKETKSALDNAHWRNQTEREKSGTLEEFRADEVKIETALSLLQGAYAHLSAASSNLAKIESEMRSLSKTGNGLPPPRRQTRKIAYGTTTLDGGMSKVSQRHSRLSSLRQSKRPSSANGSLERSHQSSRVADGQPGSYQGDQSQQHELQ